MMTPATFRHAVEQIGWSNNRLADRLGCDERVIRRWAAGEAHIPEPVGDWLERLAHAHEELPAPQDWKRR